MYMELEGNNHSVFKMGYVLYLTTNKLSPLITEEVSERLKEIYQYISPRYNISLIEWQAKTDRIKITFSAHPNTELKKFVNAYKSAASRLIKKDLPEIVDKLDNWQFWSKTFCLLTLDNGVSEDTVNAFLEKLN